MAKRFNIVNQSLTITDTVSGVVEYHLAKGDTWYSAKDLINDTIQLIDKSSSGLKTGIFTNALSNCVNGDDSDAVFTQTTFRQFASDSLGFNTAGGSSSAWYIVPFGDLHVYKLATNLDNNNVEAGDIVTGQLNGDIFLERGIYNAGDILELASYTSTKSFDPNN